jgi:hypothetical protein
MIITSFDDLQSGQVNFSLNNADNFFNLAPYWSIFSENNPLTVDLGAKGINLLAIRSSSEIPSDGPIGASSVSETPG